MAEPDTAALVETAKADLDGLCDRADYGETPDGMKREEVEPAHLRLVASFDALAQRLADAEQRVLGLEGQLGIALRAPRIAIERMDAAEARATRLEEELARCREERK